MIFDRIHIRLILFFVALMIVVLAAGGLSIQWSVRRSMEDELGKKLEAVASAASVMFDDEELGYLLAAPGPRLREYLTKKLILIRGRTGVKRIYFFDISNNGLIDTQEGSRSGAEIFSLQFYRKEIGALILGKSSHTILFRGIDGDPTMTGFSPLVLNGKVVGGSGVDGSAAFLGALDALKRRLIQTALLGSVATILLALILSGTITRPIARLVRSSEQIAHGRYDDPIPPLGKGEIGVLSETMEAMRRSVVERELELKAMVAGVAHEIRNPLGGIELFTGLLAEETAGLPGARGHVEKISREVRYLKEIVDRFLEFARPNQPHIEACGLLPILREIAALMEPELNRLSVSLSLPGENCTARVDPNHFKQMSLNLIQNAVQAMPRHDGSKVPRTEVRRSEGQRPEVRRTEGHRPEARSIEVRAGMEGSRVRLRFTDTGGGIPAENRERIFSPFFTTREKGTGLGLSIVRRLANANGGRVSLLSSDENGTVFELELLKG
jgi:signal transduction histidine kinase